MKNKLMMIMVLLASLGSAQTVKKTFYDLNGTKPKEVYSVNSKGEKNGSYKSYFEDGLLAVDANYVNGALNGVYKEYQWLGGKTVVKLSVTYKDGIKNGPATYYGGENFSIKVQQGNYVNDRKDGVWTVVEETSSSMPEGFRYFTYKQTFKAGELIEESSTWNYYPSGKLFAEKKGNVRTSFSPEGKKTGEEIFDATGELQEEKFFYLNGALAEHNKYYLDGNKKVKEENRWYENGKLKERSKTIDGVLSDYEGYDQNGVKNQTMQNWEKNNKTGVFKYFYDENWNIIQDESKATYYRVVEFKDGKPFGLVKDYYKSGQLQGEGMMKSVDPEIIYGESKGYFPNGKRMFIYNYNNYGKKEGKCVTYYENGNQADSIQYQNGIEQYAVFYNEDGSMMKVMKIVERHVLMSKYKSSPLENAYYYETTEYYPSGKVKLKGLSLVDNNGLKYTGKVEYFDETGAIIKTENYDQYGKLK